MYFDPKAQFEPVFLINNRKTHYWGLVPGNSVWKNDFSNRGLSLRLALVFVSAPSFFGYNTKQSLPHACRLEVKIILHFPSVALSHFSVKHTFTVAELAKVGTFTQERWLKELLVTRNRNVYSFLFMNIRISRNYHFKILESKGNVFQ